MSPRRVSILAAIALAIAAAPPSVASAAHWQSARFRATLTGSESTSWSLNAANACGSQTGSGSHKISFHQAKRMTLTLSRQVGGTRLLDVKVNRKPMDIPIAGEATQLGKVDYTTSPKCATGRPEGEATAPPKPDCGTRKFSGTIRPSWSTPELYPAPPGAPPPLLPVFWLDEPLTKPLFRVCPAYGPGLIFRMTRASLPEAKVFGPAGKLTVQDKVKKVSRYPEVPEGVLATTTVSWTLRLTRLTQ